MQFEVIRKNHKKEIVLGSIAFILIAIVLILQHSFAKYQKTKSIPIVEGTINYKVPDFKIMALYKQKEGSNCTEDNCYIEMAESERMPSSGYVINESKSYCTLDNVNKDTVAVLKTIDGNHIIYNLTKNEKCYLYFDKQSCGSACNTIFKNVELNESTPSFDKIADTNEGIFKAQDDDGDTYYWRGAVTNNYIKFADKYWRIIRINGDGTIRMIYDGDSPRENGSTLSVETSNFNSSYNDNMYVGFMYTSGEIHGLGTKSTILTALETWYNNNLVSYASKIDPNAGFCGDRTPYTDVNGTASGGGTGTTTTYYGAYIRLNTNKTPNIKDCLTEDFYTIKNAIKGNKSLDYSIGLITADEVAMAGGVYGKTNQSYYLYTGQNYWTLTPGYSIASNRESYVLYVYSNGGFGNPSVNPYKVNVRPVINLRSDVKLTGSGTASDPYVVQ